MARNIYKQGRNEVMNDHEENDPKPEFQIQHSDQVWRALLVVAEIADEDFARDVSKHNAANHCGPAEWLSLAQSASELLVGIFAGIFADEIWVKFKAKPEATINDLFTREVKDGIVEYTHAVDRLREFRPNQNPGPFEPGFEPWPFDEEDQNKVDVLLLKNDKVIQVLKDQGLDGLDLQTLLLEINSATPEELRNRAHRLKLDVYE